MIILIDSGSTHNFIDPKILRNERLAVNPIEAVRVQVANGESLLSERKCPTMEVKVENQKFMIEAYLLVLGGCYMVFGV